MSQLNFEVLPMPAKWVSNLNHHAHRGLRHCQGVYKQKLKIKDKTEIKCKNNS